MHYYMMNISSIKQSDEEHIKNIYPLRYQRALKYSNRDDYLRCLGAYFLLEKAIGNFSEKDMKYTKNGKPYLEGYPFFNYSHSGNYVVLILDKEKEVGIDIQVFENRDKKYVIEWAKKEAIAKLTGDGIEPHYIAPKFYKNKKIHTRLKRITSTFVVFIAYI